METDLAAIHYTTAPRSTRTASIATDTRGKRHNPNPKLKEDVFPGELGAFGQWLFRVRFLESEYASMMKEVLSGYKQDAEERQVPSR